MTKVKRPKDVNKRVKESMIFNRFIHAVKMYNQYALQEQKARSRRYGWLKRVRKYKRIFL